ERISGEAGLDEVAREMRRVRDTYGPAAVLDCSRTGSLSMLHGRGASQRFLHMFGGCTELWSNLSAEAEVFAVKQTYGAKAEYKSAGREPIDYVNSRLIVMWGWSPGDGTFGTGTLQHLKRARQHGVRVVCVDPRVTRSSRQLADEHFFLSPSTDAAALIAMAYVITSRGLQDQSYLDRHVLGFDEAHLPPGAPRGASYRAYLMGEADGVRKTPQWAEAITGMPAATIERLAVEFATSKPAAPAAIRPTSRWSTRWPATSSIRCRTSVGSSRPPSASSSWWSTTTSSPRPRATRTSCSRRRRSGSATTSTRRGRARATTRSS